MIQGTYLKVMEIGDRGSVTAPAISNNFDILDAHIHDGVTSPQINSKALAKGEVNLLIAGWVLDAGGDYKQLVTLPSGYSFDNAILKFVIASGADLGKEIAPSIIKASTNTCYVYVYTNTFDLDVVVC